MGGGDLNTKKSWHPNTMKNQERVWKAEQAAAEEKKRILELQREREEERDRAQLKDMAQRNFGAHSAASDNRLHWMYDKPDKQVQDEDYLLGKAIGKSDDGNQGQNANLALSRRVVGSSMTTTADDSQVDLARKLREDPLLLVKERERAARAALLNNPLQRKKLTELLRKEQEQKQHKMSKSKKKSKKKNKDLDNVLAAKLNALAGNKGIDLTSLLNSDDSSEVSSNDNKSKKKKKKRKQEKKKSKKKRQSSESDTDSDSSEDEVSNRKRKKKPSKSSKDKISGKSGKDNKQESRKRHSDDTDDESDDKSMKKKSKGGSKRHKSESETESFSNKRSKEEYERYWPDNDRRNNANEDKQGSISYKRDRNRNPSPTQHRRDVSLRSSPRRDTFRGEFSKDVSPRRDNHRREYSKDVSPRRDTQRREYSPKRKLEDRRNRKPGLSEAEKAARLAEMASAGAEREVERGERVARQRVEDREAAARAPRSGRHEAHALPDSLESRIRSNRHYIQRDRLHMNEHFARR